MPNYVTTELNFIGTDEDIKKIKEFVHGKYEEEEIDFDFSKIVPYPKREETPRIYLLDESKNVDDGYGLINQEAHIRIDNRFPYLDWYKWQCNNWGTKWNACSPNWSGSSVYFDTAWSFCEPIVIALSKQFPDVTIEFKYADEDVGSNCDYGWCKDGAITYADISGEAKMKFAIDFLGLEDEYEFVDGSWVYKEE